MSTQHSEKKLKNQQNQYDGCVFYVILAEFEEEIAEFQEGDKV